MKDTIIHIGIVGSRKRIEYEKVRHFILYFKNKFNDIAIVSGGAKGIDTTASLVCKQHGIPIIIHRPNYGEYEMKGNGIYHERNRLIAEQSDYLIAFPLKRRGGTMNPVSHFIKLGKKERLIIID